MRPENTNTNSPRADVCQSNGQTEIHSLNFQDTMKRLHFIVVFLFVVFSALWAEPYFVRVNGSTDYATTAMGEQDYQGRDQYFANCVSLQVGDILTCYDQGSGAEWAIAAIDPYGAYTSFNCTATGLVCQAAGQYNVYIKVKLGNDLWYIEQASECTGGGDTPDPDPDPTPDPNPVYTKAVPSACPDVMLQGFYWDSYKDGKHGDTRWKTLLSQSSEINAYFDLIWLPPSAKASGNDGGGVGYIPQQYSVQNSAWGTRSDLETLIAAFHSGGTKVVADIVVNHGGNKSTWCDYYTQDFGAYGTFNPTSTWICSTDEVNTDSKAGSCRGAATGAIDDGYDDGKQGYNYTDARDWDHNNADVRAMFNAYAQWMCDVMKYDGFRYDFAKGFHNSHIDEYNTSAKPYFSVMEYWDGDANTLWARIQDAGLNSLAFDFATKYTAFNSNLASGSFAGMKGCGLLGAGHSKYAVTFVDNHDSYQRDNNEFCGLGNSMSEANRAKTIQANAFILSMPGIPCVFYPHWKEFKSEIGPMILARKAVGVHSESPVSDEGSASGYRATVTGLNGTLIVEFGDKVSASKSGYTKAAYGTGYVIWTKITKSVAPRLIISPASCTYKTSTLTIEMTAIGGSSAATIYYTLDGSDPRTSTTRLTYTAPFDINGTITINAYAATADAQSDVQTHTYTYKAPQTSPITLSFYKPAAWEKVYLYTWTEEEPAAVTYTGEWPGIELTQQNAQGFYYYQMDEAIREINFIFNAGKGKDQTADLWTDEDVCYGWSGGAEIKLDDCIPPTAIEQVTEDIPALDITLPMYNIIGQQVDRHYQGIVIQNGHRYLR